MTSKDAILYALRFSGNFMSMMTADLSRQDLHHRVVPNGNCAAWILGHLILSERGMFKLLGIAPEALPPLPDDGFAARYAQSEAATRAEHYGDADILPALFQEHRQALMQAVQAADEAVFDRPLDKPLRIATTVGEFLLFTPIHGASHAGQISAIRRSLGRPPVV